MKFRIATKEDITGIIRLLADDELGMKRELYTDPLPEAYYRAFEKIDGDANQVLLVVEDDVLGVVGTLQLTFIQYLTYHGGVRAQIEAVRIDKRLRGGGLGKQMIEWAIDEARKRKAHVVQLTSDKKRAKAIAFYENLGFISSHEGMKLHLDN